MKPPQTKNMQNSEEYYRRTLSAKYLPINPDSKTPIIDKAIRLTGLVVDRMRAWESHKLTQKNFKSVREVFNEETQFFDEPDRSKEFRKSPELYAESIYGEPHKPKWYFLTLEMDSELRAVFHNRNESVLQNRDANYLIDYAVNLFLPTYALEYDHLFTRWEWDEQSKKVMRIPVNQHVFFDDEIDSVESDNVFFRSNVIHALHSWAKKITDYVSMYAPEIFEKHREQIESYLTHGEPAKLTKEPQPIEPESKPTNQEPQPKEPGGKLQWRGSITDLTELVWVLAKSGAIINTETAKPATIDDLGTAFSSLFGLEKLDIDGLVSKRINHTNKPVDGKMFTDTLRKLIESHPAWKV